MDLFPFDISFDFSWVENLGSQPFYAIIWHFFLNGGWILFLIVFLWAGWHNFIYWKQSKFGAKQTYIYLAIDIPRNNIQTPSAVENIFIALAGAHMPLDWHEATFKGEYQLSMSCEIVSIDGFIQFIIRTPVQWRNLVESAVYAQYSEAEITEVTDYTADITTTFPSEEFNLWGADLVFTNKDYYPIRTYKEFEQSLDQEFKDPLAAVLEVMGKIGKGEQIWVQMILSPANIGWQKSGIKAVNKLLGIPEKHKQTLMDKIADAPMNALVKVGDEIFQREADSKKEERTGPDMLNLDPMTKRQVDGILRKVEQICFNVKLRFGYYGKREVFKKGLGVAGMMGSYKQFGSTALNGFKPGGNKTQAKLWMKKKRMSYWQNKFLADYKSRNGDTCDGKQLMCVEELATLFHFPNIDIKAPMVKMIDAKKSQGPIGLPTADDAPGQLPELDETPSEDVAEAPGLDYDNDYFEKRFAVDKTGEADKKRKEQIMEKIEDDKGEKSIDRLSKDKDVKKKSKPVVYKEDKVVTPHVEDDSAEENESGPGNLPFV